MALAETSGDPTGEGGGDPVWVTISSPSDGAVIGPISTVILESQDSSNDSVWSVRLSVDNVQLPASCSGAGTCMFEVELEPGQHLLTATAYGDWTIGVDQIDVTVEEGAGPGAPADTDAQPARDDEPEDASSGDAETDGPPPGNDDVVDRDGCACRAEAGDHRSVFGLVALGFAIALRRRRHA